MKGLLSENYKTLIKETEDNSKKWGDSPCSWVGKINEMLLNWSQYSKQSTDLM